MAQLYEILHDPADNMDIWDRWKVVLRKPEVIEFYVPTNHRQENYEKRFGKFANFTPPRLRGRILEFRSN